MRQSEASYALAHRSQPDETQWLAQWNRGWQAFNFVGGHKKPSETYYECAVREVKEELKLDPDREFSIRAEPLKHLRYQAWSERANEETAYSIVPFELTLLGDADELVARRPENRWLTEDEIRQVTTVDGKPISPTMAYVLTELALWKDLEHT